MVDLIDPWASFSLDYEKLVNQFGIGKISDIIEDIKNPQLLMKRELFSDIGSSVKLII